MNGQIWRLLEVGETVKEGDEVYVGYWQQVSIAGTTLSPHHSIHRRRVTVPLWPAPRDAKTDPPKESDCDASGCVLAFVNGVWMRALRGNATSVAAAWLPLPPLPQSKADKAWDAHRKAMGWLSPDIGKETFLAGFNAGKGSK